MSDSHPAPVATVAGHGPAEHAHPGPLEYVKIALILGGVTLAEVAAYYMSGFKSVLVPVLLTMSAVKFGLVGLYFMHLKFDTRLFRRVFTMGIVLAILVYTVAIVTLFHYR